MADGIRISTQVLRDTAEKIKVINKDLDDDLVEISRNMNDLDQTWKSDGAREIISAMNAMKPRFEEYKAVVESYAKFLVDTAESYESTEQTIQTNASAFK